MTNTAALNNLHLAWQPVAVGFMSDPPAGLPRVDRPLPAGCGYWKHASEGHGFYTTPEDHYGCTVGAFTHNVALPDDKKSELESVVGTMVSLEYLSRRRRGRHPPPPGTDADRRVRAAWRTRRSRRTSSCFAGTRAS